MKIGVFDSGFGGIDIFRYITQELPEYDYLYLGDTARTPYGSRSQETIYRYTKQAVDFLFDSDCVLIIFACNTASAEALRRIQQEYVPKYAGGRNVLGVIRPAVEAAMLVTNNNRIGVLATESSVKSGAFPREIRNLRADTEIFQSACPLLVPLIESGDVDLDILDRVVMKYLSPLIKEEVDTIILGCTHYGLLENDIRRVLSVFGSHAHIINEGTVVARKLKDYLRRHSNYTQKLSRNGTRTFYTTDISRKFMKLASAFYGAPIEAQSVNLEDYEKKSSTY